MELQVGVALTCNSAVSGSALALSKRQAARRWARGWGRCYSLLASQHASSRCHKHPNLLRTHLWAPPRHRYGTRAASHRRPPRDSCPRRPRQQPARPPLPRLPLKPWPPCLPRRRAAWRSTGRLPPPQRPRSGPKSQTRRRRAFDRGQTRRRRCRGPNRRPRSPPTQSRTRERPLAPYHDFSAPPRAAAGAAEGRRRRLSLPSRAAPRRQVAAPPGSAIRASCPAAARSPRRCSQRRGGTGPPGHPPGHMPGSVWEAGGVPCVLRAGRAEAVRRAVRRPPLLLMQAAAADTHGDPRYGPIRGPVAAPAGPGRAGGCTRGSACPPRAAERGGRESAARRRTWSRGGPGPPLCQPCLRGGRAKRFAAAQPFFGSNSLSSLAFSSIHEKDSCDVRFKTHGDIAKSRNCRCHMDGRRGVCW
jgi:hypothetical protein